MSVLAALARTQLPRRVLAAVFSVLVPGAGHVVFGWTRAGWIIGGGTLALALAGAGCALVPVIGPFLVIGAICLLAMVASVISIFAVPPGPDLERGPVTLWPVFVLFVLFRGAAYGVDHYVLDALSTPDVAMLPLVGERDVVLVDRRPFEPRVGDVVAFADPKDIAQRVARRVVATAGQRVRYADGRLTVDGVEVAETPDGETIARELGPDGKPGPDRTYRRMRQVLGGRTFAIVRDAAPAAAAPVEATVGTGQVYVLADRRDHAADSRTFGPIATGQVRRALFVFMSGPSLDGRGRIWTPLASPAR